jgi:hypothetical protein
MIFRTLLFLTLSFPALSQTAILKGTVKDSRTGEPLPFANVYINRTTLGTATTNEGGFVIKNIPPGNLELICSLVGYGTAKITTSIKAGENKDLKIILRPIETQLSEITVSAKKDKKWERDLQAFTTGFLGKDEIAKGCAIENAEVLDFTDLKGNGLKATAVEPLMIINNSLGYKVRYELVHFEQYPNRFLIAGNVHFEPLATRDSSLMKRWIENREKTYRRSAINFYKSFITNRLSENGYDAYMESVYAAELRRASMFAYMKPYLTKIEPLQRVLLTDTGTFVIDVRTRMEIHDKKYKNGTEYRDVRYPVSWIELSKPLIVSPQGVPQNPLAAQYIGAMSNLRIAHLLPEDYVPENFTFQALVEKQKNLTASATEKIFIHTDKDYYYPGDPIWLKGYLKYGRPELLDSMSRTVYVEVIDTAKKVVARKTLPIQSGEFDGRLKMPEVPSSQYYVIRAYTNWMKNFSSDDFFQKALPVINPYERVVASSKQKEQAGNYRINIVSRKDVYHVGDSIQLEIEVLDSTSNAVPAELSISVTDFKLARQLPGDHIFSEDAKSANFHYSYPIEKGISVAGKVTNGKRKISEALTVTAVLGKFEDVNTFKTRNNGEFFFTGFQFYDSSGVALQALNSTNKPVGQIQLQQDFPPVTALPKLPEFSTERVHSAVVRYTDLESDAVQLKEVTVTAKREKRKDMYTTGDHAVSGDYIRSLNPSTLLNFLERGRIPRVRVRNEIDGMGILRSVIKISGMNASPLLVIDGIPFNTEQDIAGVIGQINLNEVERVEVLTSSAAMYGSRGLGGVLSITTKTHDGQYNVGNPNEFSTEDFSTFPLYGYSSFKPFKQPDGEAEVPDNLSTIYWNPYISNGQEKIPVGFIASSTADIYHVSVKGITIDGQIISGETTITIKQ